MTKLSDESQSGSTTPDAPAQDRVLLALTGPWTVAEFIAQGKSGQTYRFPQSVGVSVDAEDRDDLLAQAVANGVALSEVK